LGHDGEGVPTGIPVAVSIPPGIAAKSFPGGVPYSPSFSAGTWSVALPTPPATTSPESP
jgi:hypothetical protein